MPKEAETIPHICDKGSLTREEGPAFVEEGPTFGEVGPKDGEERILSGEEGPASVEEGPRVNEEGPLASEEGPASVEEGPTLSEVGPKGCEEKILSGEEGPASVEEGPKVKEEGPTSVEEGPKVDEEGPTLDEKGLKGGEERILSGGKGHMFSEKSFMNSEVSCNVLEETIYLSKINLAICEDSFFKCEDILIVINLSIRLNRPSFLSVDQNVRYKIPFFGDFPYLSFQILLPKTLLHQPFKIKTSMKTKILLTSAFVFLCFITVSAQTSTFEKGSGVGNLGIGLGNALYTGGGYTSAIPPISVSYEVGALDGIFDKGTLGIGGYLGYTSAKYGYVGYEWKYTNVVIGVRGAIHYPFVEKLDTYAGLMLGYDIVSVKEPSGFPGGYSALGSGLILPGFVGARYYFTDKFAGFGELGWGIAYFTIGVSLKIK